VLEHRRDQKICRRADHHGRNADPVQILTHIDLADELGLPVGAGTTKCAASRAASSRCWTVVMASSAGPRAISIKFEGQAVVLL